MAKSFVLYAEILTEENPVNCVYLLNGYCTAQATIIAGMIPSAAGYYKPTEEECKSFCNNSEKFKVCPRFTAYQMHLNALGLTKK